MFYSRDLRIVPEKFLLLRQLVFPSHNVTKHLVFCIQCDSHHWFVEEWHQVSSSRIADGLQLGLQWFSVGGDSCTDKRWFQDKIFNEQWCVRSYLANLRNGRNEFSNTFHDVLLWHYRKPYGHEHWSISCCPKLASIYRFSNKTPRLCQLFSRVGDISNHWMSKPV